MMEKPLSSLEHLPILPRSVVDDDDEAYRIDSRKNAGHCHRSYGILEEKERKGTLPKVERHRISPFVYVAAGCAALNSCNLGFDIGVNTDAATLVQNSMGLSDSRLEIFMGAMNFFAIVGALLSAKIVEQRGLRKSFIVSCCAFLLGLLIMISSGSYIVLMFGRMFVGFGVGIGMTISPMYISEISPRSHRGYFMSWFEIGFNTGILLGFMVGFFAYRFSADAGWRVMFATGCIIPLIMAFLAIFVMDESPRWLIQKGRYAEAMDVLRKLHTRGYNVQKTLREVKEDIEQEKKIRGITGGDAIILSPSPTVKRMLIVGVGTVVLQQMSGIEAIQYYLVFIMEAAGISDKLLQTMFLTGLGLLKLSCILVAGPLFDKLGRRPLVFFSLSGMSCALLLIAFDFFYGGSGTCVVLVGLAMYLASFSVGIGPLAWIIPSETFSTAIRSEGVALTTFMNRVTSTVVTSSMLSIVNMITWGGYFMFLAIVCVLSVVFFCVFLPETKGRSLEEISLYFAQTATDRNAPSTVVRDGPHDESKARKAFQQNGMEDASSSP